jgi:hypothetical protein
VNLFLDLLPGSRDVYLCMDLEGKEIRIYNQKDTINTLKQNYNYSNLYCYDLYKFSKFFGSDSDFLNTQVPIIDLQSVYGLIGCKSDTIEELFTEEKHFYFETKNRINAHLKSYSESKIELAGYSLDKIIPKKLFEDLYGSKLLLVEKLVRKISSNIMAVDFYKRSFETIKNIQKLSEKTIYIEEEKSKKLHLYFNIFGSKNSRLSIKKNSFNIYNLNKQKRNILVAPEEYFIVQFDFKSFQPRLAIALFGDQELKEQIKDKEDLYSYFPGNRDEIKIAFLAWMFSNRKNTMFEKMAGSLHSGKKDLYIQSKSGGIVVNTWGRPLYFTGEEDHVVFQNYICSVEADTIINLTSDVIRLTSGWKSHMIFPFHDALTFYIHKDEKEYIRHIKQYMEDYLSSTQQFKIPFPVEVKIGKNFLEMETYNDEL